MDDSVEIHAPEEVLQLPAMRSSEVLSKSKRAKTATSSGSKATKVEKSAVWPSRSREPKKSLDSSVSVVGQPSSDGSECHRSRSGDRKRRSHGYDRRQDSPRHHASRHNSGRREGKRARPTSSGGSSSRRQADSTGGSGSIRVPRATDARSSASSSHAHHHHRKSSGDRRSLSSSSSRASADRKSPPGHHRERKRESAERSGSSYVSRREVQLSPAITQSPEKRTITVIPSSARPDHVEETAAEVEDPATMTGPSEVVDGPADDGPASDGPAGDNPASDGPADDGSAGDGSARDDKPVVVDGRPSKPAVSNGRPNTSG